MWRNRNSHFKRSFRGATLRNITRKDNHHRPAKGIGLANHNNAYAELVDFVLGLLNQFSFGPIENSHAPQSTLVRA
ncbi:MAG: hypothetical protein A49_15950 [Methyloceanibacter sp.]|nr:MAG: hypothetical protein A49_15950 [Methyloceanibacter sp.]